MITPFAALSPDADQLQKEAFLQGAWDAVNNNVLQPIGSAAKKTLGGIGNTIGGVGKSLWNTATMQPRILGGALGGGIEEMKNNGFTLGNFLKGTADGGWNAGASHFKNQMAAGGQIAGGLKNAIGGGLSYGSQMMTAPTRAVAHGLGGGASNMWNNAVNSAVDSRMQHHFPGGMPQQQQQAPQPGTPMGAQTPSFGPTAQPIGTFNPQQPLFNQLAPGQQKSATTAAGRLLPAIFGGAQRAAAPISGAVRGAGNAASRASRFSRSRGPVIDAQIVGEGGRLANVLKNPWAKAGLVGGGLYGSNRLGHRSGRHQGIGEGYDAGSEYGMQTALASMPQDPGIIGRILNVFRGQQAGPDATALRGLLDQGKADVIGTILRGTA